METCKRAGVCVRVCVHRKLNFSFAQKCRFPTGAHECRVGDPFFAALVVVTHIRFH